MKEIRNKSFQTGVKEKKGFLLKWTSFNVASPCTRVENVLKRVAAGVELLYWELDPGK